MVQNFYLRACCALFLTAVLLIFGQLIFAAEVFNIDDYLISGLEALGSLQEYGQAILRGKIYDLQPIRDLSYWLDLQIKSLTGFTPHVLTNLVIWSGCGLIAITTLHRLRPIDSWFLAFLVATLLAHPVFVQSVALVAARKHLLALLFILLTFSEALKPRPATSKLCIFFLLSLLSHPINILFPIWYLFFLYAIKGEDMIASMRKSAPLMLLSLLIGSANWWWYFNIYEQVTGMSRHGAPFNIGDTLLAYGRIFSLVLVPGFYAIFYGKESVLNVIGLLISPIFFYLLSKRLGKKEAVSYFLLLVLILLPVTYKSLWFFVSGTYVLFSSFLIFNMIYLAQPQWSRRLAFVPLLLLATFLTLSILEASKYRNPSLLLRSSYLNDQNCINLHYHVTDLFAQNRPFEAAELGETLVKRRCSWLTKETIVDSKILLGKILAFSRDQQFLERERLLLNLEQEALYFKYARGVLYLVNQQPERALSILSQVLENGQIKFSSEEIFTRTFLSHCQNHPSPPCYKLQQRLGHN